MQAQEGVIVAPGAPLREAREAVGLSREHVARRLGISQRTIKRWEDGGAIRWPEFQLARLEGLYGLEPGALSRDAA